MFEDQKKEKSGNKRIFLHTSPSKRLFWNGIHSVTKRADVGGSADSHLPYLTHVASLRVTHSYTGQKVGHAQNI